MTHDDLVKRAAKWLKGTRRCVLVVSDFYWLAGECPDAMGWAGTGESTLVECKASRSDFHADKRKPWRRRSDSGLGRSRFYMTPKGLLTPADLPEGWGLLEVCGRIVRMVKPAAMLPYESGPSQEIRMAVMIVRRINTGREENSIYHVGGA